MVSRLPCRCGQRILVFPCLNAIIVQGLYNVNKYAQVVWQLKIMLPNYQAVRKKNIFLSGNFTHTLGHIDFCQ